MTVCVAAVCDNGRSVAIALDRQRLDSPTNVVSGTEECKIKPLAAHSAMVFTGLGTFADRLVEKVGTCDPKASVLTISKKVLRTFMELSREVVEERFVMPTLHMSVAEFAELLFLNPLGNVAQEGWKEYCNARNTIDFACAVVGADENGAHIFQAAPALIESGGAFLSIGIGREVATSVLSLVKHDAQCSLSEGLFNVVLAKTVAHQRSVAIGETTDVMVQTCDGIAPISDSVVGMLSEMCSSRLERFTQTYEERKQLTEALDAASSK